MFYSYFGGGSGILMLTALNIMGIKNIYTLQAFKNWLSTCLSAVAIVDFAIANKIIWPYALLIASGALIGGYSSAIIVRQVPASWVRYFIIGVSCAMTSYLFLHGDRY